MLSSKTKDTIMGRKLDYDPTEFGSAEEAARNQVEADREFGMPRERYDSSNEMGRRANQLHAEREIAMNDDLGWVGGNTREKVRKKWGL